jgi:phospholipid/cholesterol/gamma-HCH transport system substrate-binding protein
MRRLLVILIAVLGAFSLASCTGGVYNVNLPGGANLGSHPYTVRAQFTDVLDLVPQASVKVDDVDVGQVTKIALGDHGRIAVVTLVLNGGVHLPANATASISQTSLLGEKFVAISRPADAHGVLGNNAVIPVRNTSQGIQFEQVFGALAMLLNGGGVGQLHTIVTELNKALSGNRSAELHSLLREADTVIGEINRRRGDIIAALQQTANLAKTLDANHAEIATALRGLPAGLRVLASQRHQLVTMLNALNQLSRVTVATVHASQRSFVGDLRALAPTLQRLAAAGSDLPNSLQILLTYPFPDSVLRAIRGDYLNAFLTTNLHTPGGSVVRLHSGPPELLPPVSDAAPGVPSNTIVTAGPRSSSARAGGGG